MSEETKLVTGDDISKRWLRSLGPIPASPDELDILAGDAEDLILLEFPDIPDRIKAGTIKKSTVIRVGTRMVLRLLHNPDGARTTQESAGEFSQTRTVAGDTLGEVYLSEQDRAELAERNRGARAVPKAFTLLPRGV